MSISSDTTYVYNKLHSGLGNVLYQISTTIGLALDNNLKYTFPKLKIFFTQWGNIYGETIFRNLCTDDYKIEHKQYELHKLRNTHMDLKLLPNTELIGYYQSYLYFDKYKHKIVDIFSPTCDTIRYINNKYSSILNNRITCSVHIRRTDYCKIGITITDNYYDEATKYILNKFGNNVLFLVFSDDIPWCKQNIKGNNYVYIEDEMDYIDLYMMSMCDHNIIANSTFSWWAAYLNNKNGTTIYYKNNNTFDAKKNKYVYPSHWIGI